MFQVLSSHMWPIAPVIENADTEHLHHFRKLLNIAVLTKDPQAYSEKGQIANILGFEGHMVSGATTQICCCSMKAATGSM